MQPNEIRAELVLRGITVRSIAQKRSVALPSVSQVIAGVKRTRHIQEAIAEAIEQPVEKVFPAKEAA